MKTEADKPTKSAPADQAGAAPLSIQQIRAQRVAEEIPAIVLAKRAGVERSKLSFMECGHITPRVDELQRLSAALGELIAAKRKMQDHAAAEGWPVGPNLSTY